MREHAHRPLHNGALSRLLDTWQERDERYALLREPMSAEMEEMVRQQRWSETDRLPAEDRKSALLVLSRWSPPRPQRRPGPLMPLVSVV